jgi:spore maturation protein SpmA
MGLVRWLFFGDLDIFPSLVNSLFTNSKLAFEISLFLTGILALWMGIMKIGENGGIVKIIYRVIGPFFSKLFPDLPKNHPAFTPMFMNISANFLGLDNAATPMGLKAMKELQETNKSKDTASNAQIMFLVLNSSGLTVLPTTIMAYRFQQGAIDPTDIFLPTLIATFISTISGLIIVSIYQRNNLLHPVVLAYISVFTLLIGGIVTLIVNQPQDEMGTYAALVSNFILFGIIVFFIVLGIVNKANIYESFIEGAKDGFGVAITIIPYLVAMLVAIGVFRTSGALDIITDGVRWLVGGMGLDTRFVDALPTALMKPLSGSGARGMMLDTFTTFGVDSFAARLSSTFQGSTETTLYVVAVYFGSVGIRKTRYAITCGLFADFMGILASIVVCYFFFG